MNRAGINRAIPALAFIVAVFTAACGGGGSTPIPPPPVGGFSNASLKGQYALSMSGANNGNFFARVGSFTADGNGNITAGIEDVNVAGSGTQIISFTTPTTYSVQADGRGIINLTGSGPLLFSITLLSPTQGLIVETDGIATASGTFVLQNSSSFNTGSISGNYVFDTSGLDGSLNPDSIIGQFVANGSGGFTSGLIDENDAAHLVSAAPFTSSTYQMDSTNGTPFGRGTLSFTANGTTYNYVFYVVSGTKLRMMEAGSTALTIGDAQSQSSVPTSNTNFNGNFAFLLSGSGSTGAITRIGRLSANGSGTLTNIVADTNDTGVVARVPDGSLSAMSYSIDIGNAGTGRGTLTFNDSKLGTFQYVFYLNSSSGGVIQDISKNAVADGTIQLQAGGPFTNASLAADYGLVLSGVSTNSNTFATAEEDFVGHVKLTGDASNNVNGAMDFSEFSSNQGVFPNIVVSGNGLSIGGDGTTSGGMRNALSLKLNTVPSSTLNFAPYIVNSQTIFVAGTDSDRTISGTITVQAP